MEPDPYVAFCAGRMRHLFSEYLRDHGMGPTSHGTSLDWREERIVGGLLHAVAEEMHQQRLQAANPMGQVYPPPMKEDYPDENRTGD